MAVALDREPPDVFVAISHRARRRMLDLLADADRAVGDLAAHFAMSRPAVSQHLRVLLDAGLVAERRHGRERRYRLVPGPLAPVREWVAHYERFWDDHLGRLQAMLADEVADDAAGEPVGGQPKRAGGRARPAGKGKA